MSEFLDIPVEAMEDPIRTGLQTYSDISDGRVMFDIAAASQLQLTPDKTTAARSTTEVKHRGEVIGSLYVIAFAADDGTGDESAYKAADFADSAINYPREPRYTPRSKSSFHSEAHLTLASFLSLAGGEPSENPIPFAGSLDLASLRQGVYDDKPTVAKLAYLGQNHAYAAWAGAGEFAKTEHDATPTATLTTGYLKETGERFGDPHAVINYSLFTQICGFVAITNEMAAAGHASALDNLGAIEPKLWF